MNSQDTAVIDARGLRKAYKGKPALDGASFRIAPGRIVGLVLAPDKVTYRIGAGNYLGQNDGRVTSVNENRIELVELVPDGAGGWLERPASLALNEQ